MELASDHPLAQLIDAYLERGVYHSLTGYEEQLERLRLPKWAMGECANLSWQFTAFAASHGIKLKVRDTDPDALGYHDRKIIGVSRHTVCCYGENLGAHDRQKPGSLLYAIDWTAAQYGYDAFPLVSVYQNSRWEKISFSPAEALAV